MGKLFGTDGIRGRVNQYPITPEMALRIGKAAAVCFRDNKTSPKGAKIVIGRDTRLSGGMIESALVSGLCSMGAHAYLAGVLPTPGVAHLTAHLSANAGIVVSASHNPVLRQWDQVFRQKGIQAQRHH